MPDPEIQPPSEFQADVDANGIRTLKPSEREKIGLHEIEAIERARQIGTYGKIDRRAQYNGADRATPEALLKAVNELGNHTRGLQSDTGKMQRQLYNLKLRNTLVAITSSAVTSAILLALGHFWK